jgi:hypothetical protein
MFGVSRLAPAVSAGGTAVTDVAWHLALVDSSSCWPGGDGVDEDEDQYEEGGVDVVGETAADRQGGTVGLLVGIGAKADALLPP